MGWRGWTNVATHTKRKLTLRKRRFFVMEKHIEDIKQDQKTLPDLLELIMRSTDPVEEELRKILMKMSQFRPQI